MKRDMDLIRELLLQLEAWPMGLGDAVTMTPDDLAPGNPDYDTNQINYHMDLIRDAGFINDGGGSQPILGFTYCGLTWDGHEFLDSIRSPEIWRRTKAAAGRVGGVSFSILGEIAKATAKSLLKEHLGLDLG